MKSKGYHTVEDQDNPDYVEENGPFPSISTLAFLGTGYYFWEENMELAHWWGETHCNGVYMICEGEIKCPDKLYLDLVGSPRSMKYVRQLYIEMADELRREFNTPDVPIGAFFEYLKKVSLKPGREDTFPFKVIRAVDHSAQSPHIVKFAFGMRNSTNLSPRIMLCLISRTEDYLNNFRIIFPEKYVIG